MGWLATLLFPILCFRFHLYRVLYHERGETHKFAVRSDDDKKEEVHVYPRDQKYSVIFPADSIEITAFGKNQLIETENILSTTDSINPFIKRTILVILTDTSIVRGKIRDYSDDVGLYVDSEMGPLTILSGKIDHIIFNDSEMAKAPPLVIYHLGLLEFEEDSFTRAEISTHADLNYLREHRAKGVTMLTMHNLPQKVRDVVMRHHERSDGSSYPSSLRGADIPLEVQIVGCVETFIA